MKTSINPSYVTTLLDIIDYHPKHNHFLEIWMCKKSDKRVFYSIFHANKRIKFTYKKRITIQYSKMGERIANFKLQHAGSPDSLFSLIQELRSLGVSYEKIKKLRIY